VPNKNLVQNIGFGEDGTHTLIEEEWNSNNTSQHLNSFQQPSYLQIDHKADELTMKKIFKIYNSYNHYVLKLNEEKHTRRKRAMFLLKKSCAASYTLPGNRLKIAKKM
jgi:hypothetical protein